MYIQLTPGSVQDVLIIDAKARQNMYAKMIGTAGWILYQRNGHVKMPKRTQGATRRINVIANAQYSRLVMSLPPQKNRLRPGNT